MRKYSFLALRSLRSYATSTGNNSLLSQLTGKCELAETYHQTVKKAVKQEFEIRGQSITCQADELDGSYLSAEMKKLEELAKSELSEIICEADKLDESTMSAEMKELVAKSKYLMATLLAYNNKTDDSRALQLLESALKLKPDYKEASVYKENLEAYIAEIMDWLWSAVSRKQ